MKPCPTYATCTYANFVHTVGVRSIRFDEVYLYSLHDKSPTTRRAVNLRPEKLQIPRDTRMLELSEPNVQALLDQSEKRLPEVARMFYNDPG